METKTTSLYAFTVLLAGSTMSTSAAVVSFINKNIAIPTDFAGVSLDLETGVSSVSLEGLAGGDLNFVFGGQAFSNDADQNATTPSWQPVRADSGNTDVLENLGVGVEVGPSSTVSSSFGGSTDNFANFTPGERGYVGFSLILDDGNETVAYGWVEVTFQNNDTPGMIHSWAYDDTGEPLAVAAVPEPTQSVLIIMGLAATALRRLRS
jgi:hypothetical protein